MSAGSVERGMGDQSPPRAPGPDEGAGGAAVPQARQTPAPPDAGIPRQVSSENAAAARPRIEESVPGVGGAADDDIAADCIRRLHGEISQELRENLDRLRGHIYLDGYREPTLSVLSNATQTRYYQARSKPGFVFKSDGPWPLLKTCYGYARLDFHRQEGRQPEPKAELPSPNGSTADSAVDRVIMREAIKAFLEKNVPDQGEREVYRLTHMEGMGRGEIAEKLGIDRGTVTARLDRAEERLRSLPPGELDTLR
ncbi:sigma factor-like helix-turn-helix DNA-binding protein [Streptomyces ossamyceticus]|uniref:RNA polymerase sigma factor n=1 Tax=Streptomyces ossamyceticus TaxID=249581 RepID=UPI0036E5E2E6